MKKGLKNLLILGLVGLMVGLGVVYYVFNKPHRDVEGEVPAYTMEAKALFDEYNANEEAGNLKFGDKVIQVTGEIVELSNEGDEVSFVLNDGMEGVNCALDSMMIVDNKALVDKLAVGDKVTVKGKCDGFDMIMGVVFTSCFIIEE
jgi:hypothetical protein